MPERSKPFLLVGSSLTAIFVAGMMALTIAVAVNVRPTADQGSDVAPVPPGNSAPPPAVQSAPPAAAKQVPRPAIPVPAPAAPPAARIAMAQLKDLPAAATASGGAQRRARPGGGGARTGRSTPARCGSPVIPPPIIQLPVPFVPPILQPPPYYNPRPQGPTWYPGPSWRSGHGGSHHGHGGGD